MEKLKELVQIVNQIKISRIEIIGKGRYGKEKKIKRLYEGVVKGKFNSDTEAAKFIYGTDYKSTNYTSLKNHLTNKLINSLFFINLSGSNFNQIQKAYYECQKLRSAVQILSGKGAKKSSIEIAEKLLIKSLKFQFTEISLELSKLLRRHFRIFEKKKSKAIKYDLIVKEQLEIFIAETEIEDMYERLIEGIEDKRSGQNSIAEKAKVYANKAKEIFPRLDSQKLGKYANSIFVLEYELSRNYTAVETTCLEAIHYYQAKGELGSEINSLVFYIKLLGAYIPLQKFKEGEEVVLKILGSIVVGSINWFVTLELYFLLSLHTGNYHQGASILKEASSHKKFKKLKKQPLEMWLIYEAYIEFLRIIGELKKESKNNFRVARFMNQVPNFSKDKTGINISILVIQILLLVVQRKEAKVIDRVEALRTYVYTYLRKDDSLRSNYFIKMLLRMVETNFHKNGTIRKTKSLFERLEQTPISSNGHSQYIEIIPYEKLWELILKQLGNRAY